MTKKILIVEDEEGLVEGIRLNNSVFRDGPNQYWNTVDPYSMGRVEVARGPASVLYGSDAVGGVVNVMSDLKARPDGFTPRALYLVPVIFALGVLLYGVSFAGQRLGATQIEELRSTLEALVAPDG